jgi:hypothetical protein
MNTSADTTHAYGNTTYTARPTGTAADTSADSEQRTRPDNCTTTPGRPVRDCPFQLAKGPNTMGSVGASTPASRVPVHTDARRTVV